MKATKVTAGVAESNGNLLPGLLRDSLYVTCGLTACTPGSAPGPTLGNEYGKTLPLPYRAMLETLLSYGGDAKKSQLTSALYYRDQADRTDSVTFDANGISGLKTRKTFTTTSNPVDMFFQSRYLLNEVNVKIKLTRCTVAGSQCVQSLHSECNNVCAKSQAVSIRVLGTCQGAGKFHGKVSDKSRGV